MSVFFSAWPLLLAGLLVAPALAAQTMPNKPEADSLHQLKRGYTLLRPTPTALLRPLSTDRPDVTESAYTLDAGHFQLESELLRFTRQRENGRLQEQEIALNHINLKMGLSRTTDIEAVIETYTWQKDKSIGEVQRRQGFGDLTLRLKRNVWGNEGGTTALALLPFITLPMGQEVGDKAVEGGLATPFVWQLPADWTLGSQLKASLLHDEDAKEHFLELAPSITAGHDIYRSLAGFAEVSSTWDTRSASWQATFDTGLTLGLGENAQLDAGTYLPLTHATAASWFLGLSFRR
ncbi:hypothetical protein PK28_16025 [Hymenobacter sp. DG25B]|jgi:hypothetical protein|uniref:transporter n=1 Tax=Hymenobacter sp. DG25B TaxID=1385664 RepID=UPI000540FBAB|nr:transporter [Hymenobacter sp. DG25B]AIZ64807.1 hypothetical protein PK28_16025 [Hymenobacter sp. DG25B]